jgi:F0F1-type ATP synthase beta subunit
MFYLRGVSQREMAAFLGIPVSTVNNRLHEARAKLKRRLLTMVAGNIGKHRLDNEFAENIGRIISVRGPVIEAKFDAPARTDIFDILAIADSAGQRVEKMKVVQRLADGTVRAVAVASLTDVAVGASITNVGGVGDAATPALPNPAMSDEDVTIAVQTLGRSHDQPLNLLETGIKPIDLFCPLPAGGNVGLFGIQGVGRIVLAEELFHRLGGRAEGPRLFYLVHGNEPDSVRGMLGQETGYPGDVVGSMQVIWLLSDMATDTDAADRMAPFDAVIYCHPLLGARGLWPAVDPMRSNSALLRQAIADASHRDTANRARQLLQRAHELMTDPVLLELLACRALRQARERVAAFADAKLAQLSKEDRRIVQRARKLENFLTNPFFVAEKYNGRPGKFVPLSETIRGCNMIMDGVLDSVGEKALAYIGTIDEAIKK